MEDTAAVWSHPVHPGVMLPGPGVHVPRTPHTHATKLPGLEQLPLEIVGTQKTMQLAIAQPRQRPYKQIGVGIGLHAGGG